MKHRTRGWSLHQQMGALLFVSVVGFVVMFMIAWRVVEQVKVHGATFDKMTQGKDLVADALPPPSYLLALHDTALLLLRERDSFLIQELIRSARLTIREYEERHAFWVKAAAPQSLLDRERVAYEAGHEFVRLVEGRLIPLVEAGYSEQAARVFGADLQPAFERHRTAVLALVQQARAYTAQIAGAAQTQEDSGKLLLVGVVGSFSILVATWGYLLARRLEEQRREKQRQQDDDDRYRFALEAANMGAWEWNIASGEVAWAGGVEAVFGLAPGTFERTYAAYLRLIHAEDRSMVEAAIAGAIAGDNEDYYIEHRVVLADGNLRWLEGKGSVVRHGGEALRMRGTVSDISQRKMMEGQRAELEARLRQSQRMEAMGKLAGGVAHDFNNLLTSLMGCNELALRATQEAATKELLEEIQRGAHRAAALTRQLLAFSRKQVWQPEILDLNVVVRGLESMLTRLLGPNITLSVEPGPGGCVVKADRGQIEQVLLNLVVNARDAMPNGGTIRVACGFADRLAVDSHWGTLVGDGAVVMLTVADEGSGISPEVRANLFQPYFTTKPEGKGTGLGLSTVYGIVQQTGGAIGLETEPGKGCTFKIYLEAAEAPVTTHVKVAPKPSSPKLQGTILVADDERAIARVVKLGLEQQGFTVVIAYDAESALIFLRANPGVVDLLLTDIMMPGKGGRALAEEASTLRPGIKIVFMSGFTADETMHDMLEKLGAGLIHKPFSLEALCQHVRLALRGEHMLAGRGLGSHAGPPPHFTQHSS